MSLEASVICGVGLVTPLGHDLASTFEALTGGRFITDLGRVKLAEPVVPDRVTALARLAAEEAIDQAGWSESTCSDRATALIVATSKGPIDAWLNESSDRLTTLIQRSDNPAGGRRCGDDSFGLASVASQIARDLHIIGPSLTISAACASGLIAIIRAIMMLREGIARQVLVVASESSLHPLFISSFQRLGVLARSGDPIRPFDQNRSGFHISEAAAAICLEHRASRSGDICIERFALAGDAHHLTAGDPNGRILQRCLATAIGGEPVDLFHAHGTATRLNDPIELAAIDQALIRSKTANPFVYSHKSALGHTLGAAGLISLVLNCQLMRSGTVPGNTNTPSPLATSGQIHSVARAMTIHRVVTLAAGFGGSVAAVSQNRVP